MSKDPQTSLLDQNVSSTKRLSKAPRSIKQHILRRLIVMIPVGLFAVVAVKMGWLPVASDKVQFDDLAWYDNTKLIEHLRILANAQGSIDVPRRCIVPIINGADPAQATHIQFLIRATDGCPGVNGKTGTAFTILVDRANRHLQTDAGTPGDYHEMPAQ